MSRSERAPGLLALLAVPAVVAALVFIVASSPAAAQAVRRVGLMLMVSHASQRPGPVDPAAAWLDRSLRGDFRYQSLHVLEQRHLDLRLQEIGGVVLPTGKRVSIRPLHVGDGGLLISVDIEGTLETDVRIPNRSPVVIGVDSYDDGKLIVTLEPDY
jgi:hypothetical protein